MIEDSAQYHRLIHACKSFVDMGHLILVITDLKQRIYERMDAHPLNDNTREFMYHAKAYLSALNDIEFDMIKFADEANEEIKEQQAKKEKVIDKI